MQGQTFLLCCSQLSSPPGFSPSLVCLPPLFLVTPSALAPPSPNSGCPTPRSPKLHMAPCPGDALGSGRQKDVRSPRTLRPVGIGKLRPWASHPEVGPLGVEQLESPGTQQWEPNNPTPGPTTLTSGHSLAWKERGTRRMRQERRPEASSGLHPSYDRALRDGSPGVPWVHPAMRQFMLSGARVSKCKSWLCHFLAW